MTDMYTAAPCNSRMPYADKDTSLSGCDVHRLMELLDGIGKSHQS